MVSSVVPSVTAVFSLAAIHLDLAAIFLSWSLHHVRKDEIVECFNFVTTVCWDMILERLINKYNKCNKI